MNEWLVLAAFVASGILVAWYRRGAVPRAGETGQRLDRTYLQGLNLLLNDQQDEAIDLFVRVLEVNHETVEIHLALGKLFRQRGEVERAIRLHQNLIARPNLDRAQKEQALFELGEDYLCAGLLDRAERLFADLAGSRSLGEAARRRLLRVYEEEKEWEKAVEVARRLDRSRYRRALAHYYCELAEQAQLQGETGRAQRLLKRALSTDRACVRAALLLARIDLDRGRARKAADRLLHVREQDAAMLPLVVEPLMSCFEQLGRPRRLGEALEALLPEIPGRAALEAWVDLLLERDGAGRALAALRERLERCPDPVALRRYLELTPESGCPQLQAEMRALLAKWVPAGERFRCDTCGFDAGRLYWRCPSCKGWGTMKPIEETPCAST